MPREMAYGRPGSKAIPDNWSESLAPVAEQFFTAECDIHAPSPGTATLDRETGLSVPGQAALLYRGPCRIWVEANSPAVADTAAQQVTTQTYRVAIPAAIATVVVGAVVTVTKTTMDKSIDKLRVDSIERGSEIWQRDLICFDDLG
jgi:hypothetical protein